jgi:hypothetical protein
MHSEMAHIAERHRRTGRVAFVSLLGFLFPVGRERGVAQLLVGLPVGEEFAIDRLGATVLFAPFIFHLCRTAQSSQGPGRCLGSRPYFFFLCAGTRAISSAHPFPLRLPLGPPFGAFAFDEAKSG